MDGIKKDELISLAMEYEQAFAKITQQQEDYWNSLTKEQQLDLFCCVVRRLVKGELVDKRSYRGVLYDTFEFGLESYILAQDAGFIDLHNAIKVD